jgi:hypothetical protein
MGCGLTMRLGIILTHTFKEVPIFIVKGGVFLAKVPDFARIIAAFGRTAGRFRSTPIMLTHLDVGINFDNGRLTHADVNKFGAVGE